MKEILEYLVVRKILSRVVTFHKSILALVYLWYINTEQNRRKTKQTQWHIHKHLICRLYIPVILKERIHKHVPKARIIHNIVSWTSSMWKEYKIAKGLLVKYSLDGHMALLFPGRIRDSISTGQRPETKRRWEWFSETVRWNLKRS